jgi:hypothetical protein
MARRRRKTSAKKKGGLRAALNLDPAVRQVWVAGLGKCAVVLALVGATAVGMNWLRGYVHALPEYNTELRLELVGMPAWLERPEHRHIVDSVRAAAAVSSDCEYLDEDLARRIAGELGRSGWIRSVGTVEKCYGGAIRAKCEFRKPIAWVMCGDWCYLVDGEGVRLPGRYAHIQVKGAGLLQIAGVRESPPDVGAVWPGRDLTAGVQLAEMIEGCDFRKQINGVLVYNYNGREDSYEPHIQLATDRPGGRIRWGRAPGSEVGIEPSAGQKIALLRGIYRKYRRVDMGRPYVDIRRSPYSVDVPTESGDCELSLRS